MRIQSKWVDYYDFISHRYGQDPLCTYVRGPLRDWYFDLPSDASLKGVRVGQTKVGVYRSLSILVAGLHAIPLIGHEYASPPRFEPFREEHVPLLHMRYDLDAGREVPAAPVLPSEEQLRAMIRAVGAPVFRVSRVDRAFPRGYKHQAVWRVFVDTHVPILKNCGIPSLVPPEQMWQSIYEVLTAVLRKDPDKEPPRTVSNEERIDAAGFDRRTSFRDPVTLRDLAATPRARGRTSS